MDVAYEVESVKESLVLSGIALCDVNLSRRIVSMSHPARSQKIKVLGDKRHGPALL